MKKHLWLLTFAIVFVVVWGASIEMCYDDVRHVPNPAYQKYAGTHKKYVAWMDQNSESLRRRHFEEGVVGIRKPEMMHRDIAELVQRVNRFRDEKKVMDNAATQQLASLLKTECNTCIPSIGFDYSILNNHNDEYCSINTVAFTINNPTRFMHLLNREADWIDPSTADLAPEATQAILGIQYGPPPKKLATRVDPLPPKRVRPYVVFGPPVLLAFGFLARYSRKIQRRKKLAVKPETVSDLLRNRDELREQLRVVEQKIEEHDANAGKPFRSLDA